MMQRLWRIARTGLWLGTTVFGGVAAAYPLVRERAAELGDLTPEEVDGLYALAVLLPAFVLVVVLPLLARIPWVGAHAGGALRGAVWATAGLLLATGLEALRKQKAWAERAAVLGLLGALLLGVHPVLLGMVAL